MLTRILASVLVVTATACTPVVDDRAADAGDVGVDAGDVDAGFGVTDACPDDVCTDGCADTIDGVCLPPRIDPDVPFRVVTTNEGCRGSSCTIVQPSVCDVRVEGSRVVIGGAVCFAHDPNTTGCTEDCGGASGAVCAVDGLAAGTWTFVVGDDERDVVVPYVGPQSSSDCFGGRFF